MLALASPHTHEEPDQLVMRARDQEDSEIIGWDSETSIVTVRYGWESFKCDAHEESLWHKGKDFKEYEL